jgi:ankyrin repeat protein
MGVLTIAAAGRSQEVVELLLKASAYIDSQDNFGLTALMRAITNGRKEVVKCLLGAGASIDRYNKFDGIALPIGRSSEYNDIEELLNKRSGL